LTSQKKERSGSIAREISQGHVRVQPALVSEEGVHLPIYPLRAIRPDSWLSACASIYVLALGSLKHSSVLPSWSIANCGTTQRLRIAGAFPWLGSSFCPGLAQYCFRNERYSMICLQNHRIHSRSEHCDWLLRYFLAPGPPVDTHCCVQYGFRQKYKTCLSAVKFIIRDSQSPVLLLPTL
jgi:hypothetical protein